MCNTLNYSSPTSIKNFLKDNNFAMQKKWGQNFLIDEKVRENIIKILGDIEGKNVWEVGAGLGTMTHLLATKHAHLTLFEIDAGFISFLKKTYLENPKYTHINLIEGDVLKRWKNEVKKNGMPDIFFGCLPYNISIDLLLSLFKEIAIFDRMLITVQREVANKMLAKETKKEYAPLSVFTNHFYECKVVCDIPPSCFWPQPKVTSSAVLLIKKEDRKLDDERLFVHLVLSLFSSRRRTIKNNLNAMLKQGKLLSDSFDIDAFFNSLNLTSSLRAENLKVEDFVAITNKLKILL